MGEVSTRGTRQIETAVKNDFHPSNTYTTGDDSPYRKLRVLQQRQGPATTQQTPSTRHDQVEKSLSEVEKLMEVQTPSAAVQQGIKETLSTALANLYAQNNSDAAVKTAMSQIKPAVDGLAVDKADKMRVILEKARAALSEVKKSPQNSEAIKAAGEALGAAINDNQVAVAVPTAVATSASDNRSGSPSPSQDRINQEIDETRIKQQGTRQAHLDLQQKQTETRAGVFTPEYQKSVAKFQKLRVDNQGLNEEVRRDNLEIRRGNPLTIARVEGGNFLKNAIRQGGREVSRGLSKWIRGLFN